MELSMNLRLEVDDCISFSSQSMGYAPSLSAASSSHDPYTPNSGRDTPASRASASEMDAPYASMENMSFATPPPATAPAYYPIDPRSNPSSAFAHDNSVPCAVPREYHSQVDYAYHPSNAVACQVAPPRNMGFYHPVHTHPSHYYVQPSQAPAQAPCGVVCEDPSIWSESLSPENLFDSQGQEARSMPTRAHHDVRRRQCVDEVRHRSTALQRAQESPPAQTGASHYRRESSSEEVVIRAGIPVKKIASGTFKCPVKGCPSKHAYKRSEHLKRHYKSKHDPGCIFTDCPFCESPRKTFDRFDNFKQHIELHTRKDRRGSRVKHVPEAELLLAELNKNIKPRRTKAKSKSALEA